MRDIVCQPKLSISPTQTIPLLRLHFLTYSDMGMQFPSPLRVSHLKPICLAVCLIIALLYIFPKHELSQSTGALQALKPSVSHYSDEYRHNSSHEEPAAPPPSFDFIDLNKLDTALLSNAHYNPYVESNGIWRSSRRELRHALVHEASMSMGTQMTCFSHMQSRRRVRIAFLALNPIPRSSSPITAHLN